MWRAAIFYLPARKNTGSIWRIDDFRRYAVAALTASEIVYMAKIFCHMKGSMVKWALIER